VYACTSHKGGVCEVGFEFFGKFFEKTIDNAKNIGKIIYEILDKRRISCIII
jgi:hypothetical protein